MSMAQQVPKPLFNLRGHDAGVTALSHYISEEKRTFLISGDENGKLIVWNLDIFRQYASYKDVSSSRIQSLRVVELVQDSMVRSILVAQTRDDDVKLIDLARMTAEEPDLRILQTYPTYSALFSRGDTVSCVNKKSAIMAYPSLLENHLVTIRAIGYEGETLTSGTAQRSASDTDKTYTVFDIMIRGKQGDEYLVLVGYEDGKVCIFSFDTNERKIVPELKTEGFDIRLLQTIELGIEDFVSAFDLSICDGKVKAVFGSPLHDIVFMDHLLDTESKGPILNKVELKRQGVASVKIRPDNKLVAIGCWDASVKLYSMKSRKFLAKLPHHSKQVCDIDFVVEPSSVSRYQADYSKLPAGHSGTSYLLCCASMEGTISVLSIY